MFDSAGTQAMTDDWCETGPVAPSTLEPFSALKLNRRSVDSTAPQGRLNRKHLSQRVILKYKKS